MKHMLSMLAFAWTAGLPLLASAQSTERTYPGEQVPAGSHVETRPNPYVIAAGATLFAFGYSYWIVDAFTRVASSQPVQDSNWSATSLWRALPFVGPLIQSAEYDRLQIQDCAALQRMIAMAMAARTSGASPCVIDPMTGMTTAQPRVAIVGDWVWASLQASVQVLGVAMVLGGIFAERVIVRDGARAGRQSRWSLVPGAGQGAVGLTLSLVHF